MVTMKWWDDLWLNEGFASLLMYFAMDHVYPDWDIVSLLWIMFILTGILYIKYDYVYPDWDIVSLL